VFPTDKKAGALTLPHSKKQASRSGLGGRGEKSRPRRRSRWLDGRIWVPREKCHHVEIEQANWAGCVGLRGGCHGIRFHEGQGCRGPTMALDTVAATHRAGRISLLAHCRPPGTERIFSCWEFAGCPCAGHCFDSPGGTAHQKKTLADRGRLFPVLGPSHRRSVGVGDRFSAGCDGPGRRLTGFPSSEGGAFSISVEDTWW